MSLKAVFELDRFNDDVERIISRFKNSKKSLFIKLMEEIGEYAEVIKYDDGDKRKLEKFNNVDVLEKFQEEIADILLIVLALARKDGLDLTGVLKKIKEKFSD